MHTHIESSTLVTPSENQMPEANNQLIHVKNVTKKYFRDRIEIPVLTNISLSVPEGEFLALMGPSGSGKTTLLNLIAGIDRPTAGDIVISGQNISSLNEKAVAKWRAQHIGFVFQFYNLLPVLTAFENVELPLLLTNLSKQERKKQVELALKLVGLGDRSKHFPKQLSGGQEQRVAIARAIITDPTIIVADEPTGDLDKSSAAEIMTLLDRLNKEFKKTIIIVTHDPRAAEKAHKIMHLDKGELTN
ncbi:MAG: transporter ATP-binding protein [Bacteroidetes bacterium]|nr:transporter ATP-binding protein [Bacteroidota bacterium]